MAKNYLNTFFQILLATIVAAAYAEAEAEADPAVLYSGYYGLGAYHHGYYGLGYGYAGYPYAYHGYYGLGGKSAPCVNHLNQPVPCAGKRKREAEADAEADPYYLYSGYYSHHAGYYGYPYAYGYGYPYYNGFYAKSAPCVNHLNQAVPCA